MKAKIAICASGEGSNFESLVRFSAQPQASFEVVGLITSRAKTGAEGRAGTFGIKTSTLNPKSFASRAAWDEAFLRQVNAWSADWVILAGYLKQIGPGVLSRFKGRIVNSHPSLLPQFGGSGMYGDRVHEAVLAAGKTETGITIHLVDEEYDRGLILAQLPVAILPDDSVDTLRQRLKLEENSFYPKIVNDLVSGRLVTR